MKTFKTWVFLAFVVTVLMARQTNVGAIGTFESVMSDHSCNWDATYGWIDENYVVTGFEAVCTSDLGDSCNENPFYFDAWAACVDYCEDSDWPTGAGAYPSCYFGQVGVGDDLDGCTITCPCQCMQ